MKYPKVLQVLLVASMVTTAAPGAAMPVYASAINTEGEDVQDEDRKETPEEYEERTEYELPEGYHYVLEDDKYVTFDEDGEPVIEKDGENEDGQKTAGNEDGNTGTAEDSVTEENDQNSETGEGEAEENEETGDGEDSESGEDGQDEDNSAGEEGGQEEDTTDGAADAGEDSAGDDAEEAGDSGEDNTGDSDNTDEDSGNGDHTGDIGGAGINGGAAGGEAADNEEDNAGEDEDNREDNADVEDDNKENGSSTVINNGAGGSNGNIVIGSKKEIGIKSSPGGNGKQVNKPEKKKPLKSAKKSAGAKPASEKDGAEKTAKELVSDAFKKQAETDADFETSAKFLKLGERIRYNVEVPIEGLPSFITQEMIIGALKAQDETGYPASVTIAQIIQESGYGKYGPGGEDGEGLSYLAYQYCNLFGIKGKGTIGSAKMNTLEMTADGQTYSTRAGFRAYNTYTECIEDRSKLLEEVYSDLTEDVTDANTFAVKVGSRWATDINYSRSLIRTMERYDLYRLDELTLKDFSKLIGRFADPCPGAVVSSNYGYRTFDHSFHKGLDLGTGTENIPTYAADAGTVIFAGEAGTAGNMVVIDHGDGLITKYMHHYEIFVEEGQEVEKGQQIGLSGTTGYSTGNHLHFQVEENGKAVDPMKYLSDEGSGQIVRMREPGVEKETVARKTDAQIAQDRQMNRFEADMLAEELSISKLTARMRDYLAIHRING